MLFRQFSAASARSLPLSSTRTSFPASAKVAAETSGPTAGAVPKAGGVPAGGGVPVWASTFGAMAAPTSAADDLTRKLRRDFDMMFSKLRTLARATRHPVPRSNVGNRSIIAKRSAPTISYSAHADLTGKWPTRGCGISWLRPHRQRHGQWAPSRTRRRLNFPIGRYSGTIAKMGVLQRCATQQMRREPAPPFRPAQLTKVFVDIDEVLRQ